MCVFVFVAFRWCFASALAKGHFSSYSHAIEMILELGICMRSCAKCNAVQEEKWASEKKHKKSDDISSHVNHLHSLKMHKVGWKLYAKNKIDVEWDNVVWLCDSSARKAIDLAPKVALHLRHFSFNLVFPFFLPLAHSLARLLEFSVCILLFDFIPPLHIRSCFMQVNVLMKWSYCCATNVLLAWRSTVNRIIFMPKNSG